MIIAIILACIILVWVFIYNNLISKINQIKNAEGTLNAILKERYDVLPNLVEVAKQYMAHEDKMFTKIIELRTHAVASKNVSDTIAANKELDQTLKTFMVNVENYPTLLSNQNFIKIQESLMDLEANIAAARRFFNTAIVDYNESIQMIPGNIVASLMGLKEKEIYTIPEGEKETPQIKNMFK